MSLPLLHRDPLDDSLHELLPEDLSAFHEDVVYSVVDVSMSLDLVSSRIGFSIASGSEVGVVLAVSPGSSADRAGLVVGDRVLAVNGREVEGASHDELVQLIQQCIATRSVSLRVRRRTDDGIGDDLCGGRARLREAFLVSVKKEDSEGIIERIHRNFPEVRTFDMEEVAATAPCHLEIPKVHGGASGQRDFTEETEKIKKYDDEIRERRENQQKRQKENELLRSSLRASKKLKNLSSNGDNNNSPAPIQETRVDEDAEDGRGYSNKCYVVSDTSYREGLDKAAEGADSMPMDQIILSVERIAAHLSSSEDSRLLRDFFSSAPVQSAISSVHHPADGRRIPPPPTDTQGQHEHVRIVTLFKEDDSYVGATVRMDEQRMIIGRIVAGGIAESCGMLQEGDELLEVNGLDLRGRNVSQVYDVLKGLSGEIRFVINTEHRKRKEPRGTVKRLKALFDYDPDDDIFVPCRELALSFHRGDVLHVCDTSDDNWWQATVDGKDAGGRLAGIVPSPTFRIQTLLYAEEQRRDKAKETRRKKQKESVSADEEGPSPSGGPSLLPPYEEVSLHLARSSHKRALVLCGPEGVGCLQLRQCLLEEGGEALAAPVPYTSRSPRQGEVDGLHYHFVSRATILEMSKAGKLVEFGEFEKNLYGTSLDDIVAVRERGKTCVLTLKPQSLSSIRIGSVMPLIVFVSPPSVADLRSQRLSSGLPPLSHEALSAIVANGTLIQQQYGHLLDVVLPHSSPTSMVSSLRDLVHRLSTEPFWVPSSWLF